MQILGEVLDAAGRSPLGANPRVGAAIVAPDGRTVVGFHMGAGTAHAEADALARAEIAGIPTAGSTCIVTLEPCAHEGRTPSCAKSLVSAGVSKVLYAVADPHSIAAGGAEILRDAGVECTLWEDHWPGKGYEKLVNRAVRLNERWFLAKKQGRPFVTAKIAQTLDGKVAAADGTSQWITGPSARMSGHALRAAVDAIAVGSGTLAADNPSLTARVHDGAANSRQPLRVVIGETEVPADAKVRGSDGRFLWIPSRDLAGGLSTLANVHGVEHLLIEGGPTLISAAVKADVVDDLFVHVAPTFLGAGMPSVSNLGIETLGERIDWEVVPQSLHLEGRDLVFHAVPCTREPKN